MTMLIKLKLFKLTHNEYHTPITIIILAESLEEAKIIANTNTKDKHWLSDSIKTEEIDITSKSVVAYY